MPTSPLDLDILVKGAGPAGLTAALRLLQLGYRVGIVERMILPRAQIGEALTPGVANILELLGAQHVLDAVPCRLAAPVLAAWETREPAQMPGGGSGSLLVDRGAFDAALLSLFIERGGVALTPARIRAVDGEEGAWLVSLHVGDDAVTAKARVLIDAGGRAIAPQTRRLSTAAPLLATWADVVSTGLQAHTLIEALTQGWLWGTPLPGGACRVMLLDDPRTARQSAGYPGHRLQRAVTESRLFAWAAAHVLSARVQACDATPHVDQQAWSAGWIKTGDAAFAVDPLSSSGVEKAMRFSLQTAVAVNTWMADPASGELARRFHHERLTEGVARHADWARQHYQRAWPGRDHPFWAVRGADIDLGQSAIGVELARSFVGRPEPRTARTAAARLPAVGAVRVCHEVGLADELCVVDDRVQRRPAITHPGLDRPTAFVQGQAVVQLLDVARSASRLETVVDLWSYAMPVETARRIAGGRRLRNMRQMNGGTTAHPGHWLRIWRQVACR